MLLIINRFLPVIFLLFLMGCSALNNQSADLSIQDLYQKGNNAYQQGDYQQAQLYWKQGLAVSEENKETNEWAAYFFIGLARAAESSGSYQEAIHLAEQALHIANVLSSKSLQAGAHVIIGQTYRRMGDYSIAKHHSELARQIAHQINDSRLESDSIRNLGAIHKNQGRLDHARASYQTSLALAYEAKDKWLQAKALNNLGELSQRKGEYPDALAQYDQSLQLRKIINDLAGQGIVYGNICRVYQDLNDYERALKHCKHALKIARKIHDSAREANHLNNIAGIYRALGKFSKVKDYYHQSATIKQKLMDRNGVARAFNNIALIFKLEGKNDKALEYFSKSLNIKKQLEDRSGQSATYYNIGWTYSGLGQYNKALEYLQQALLIQIELDEPGLLWRIYDKLSDAHNKSELPGLAIFFGKLAVNTIQSLRSDNQTLDKDLQKRFLEDKRVVYEQLANLLIDQGRLLEAQQVLGMLKEEEYFDFIQRSGAVHSTQTSYTKTEADYETRYRSLTARLVESSLEYTEIKQKKASGQALTSPEEQRLSELKLFLKEVRKTYDGFYNELKQVFAQDNYSEEFAERDLDKINQNQDILTENTMLIYYLYTDEKLRIMLTDSNLSSRPTLYENFISRSELNHLIFAFREKISARNDSSSEEAQALFKHLIKPMKADLDRLKPETLLIFPSRSLRYLPFSALHNGEHYLVEQYAIAMYNAAAGTKMLSEKPQQQWNVAGFGVSQSRDPEFNNLPAVEYELDVIVKENVGDEEGILPGSQYMNLAFTADQLMDAMNKKDAYQVFHLATHFKLTPDSKDNSFLLAGDGNHISLNDFDYDDYQMAGKDLITLSACETALGEFDDLGNDGREVETLGTLMQEKGAHAVLATLWAVADQSTAVFMEQFYTLRESQNLSKAEAIRQTQLLFIRNEVFRNEVDGKVSARGVSLPPGETSNAQFLHPYYWAPFILMGNWQ